MKLVASCISYGTLVFPNIGLQLKLIGETEPKLYSTYAWAPFTGSRDRLGWLTLSLSEMVTDHVRCFHASDGEKLADLLPALESGSSTKAVILINNSDSCHIDQECVGPPWPVPVLVVALSTGRKIEGLLSMYGKQVEVKVDLKSDRLLYSKEPTSVMETQSTPKQEQQGMYAEKLIHSSTITHVSVTELASARP